MSSKQPLEIVESRWHNTGFTDVEIDQLRELGRSLARTRSADPVEEDESSDLFDDEGVKTWIRCSRSGSKAPWRLLVPEAIGAVGTLGQTIIVHPKIPSNHFMHIAKYSIGAPHVANAEIHVESLTQFWEVLAHWFVTRLEAMLSIDLYRDYRGASSNLRLIRGAVNPILSTQNWLMGKPEMFCEFEEFDADNAINRTLHEAVLRIAGSPFITSYDLKRRARVAGHHFEGLSSFNWSDLYVDFDRSAQSWMPTFDLASRIIHASGESVSPGTKSGASFLFRTPLLMEDGLREILRSHLVGFVEVSKRSKKLIPETLSASPDLVLDAPAEILKLPSIVLDSGVVVGDVKYKISEGKWTKSRADLAQLVFFASAFQSAAGFLVNFQTTPDYASADDAFVGNVPYRMIAWDTTLEDPSVAEAKFVGEVRQWLLEVLSESGLWHHLESVS